MKFLLVLAALAAVAYADVEVFVNDQKLEDPRLQHLDQFNHLTLKHGDSDLIILEEVEGKNIVNDQIIALLEKLREQMQDPWQLETMSTTFSIPLLFKATLSLRNNVITGLKKFIIDNINFNILRLSLDFNVIAPEVKYECDFDVDGRITIVVPFDFGGHMWLKFKNFELGGKAALGTNDEGYLTLKEFLLNLDVEKTGIHFDGIIGNGPLNDIFNWLLSQLTDGTIKKIVAGISDALSAGLFDILNEALGNIKLGDLIG